MNYAVLTFGCRANQADSCRLDADLRCRGAVPSSPDEADIVVVNTCSVTAAADRAARNAIQRLARTNPGARIVATGCYATRDRERVATLPGVVMVAGNPVKGDIAGQLLDRPPFASSDLEPGERGRTAYPLLVQSGCDESCAYCIVPSTRGRGRSRPIDDVTAELRRASASGFREFWITGVHLGSYGRDLVPCSSLSALLTALEAAVAALGVTFRLSSVEPMDCDEALIDLMAAAPAFLPHLHLPLQHASDRMLRSMRRPYTLDRFRSIVDRVRARIPDAALGSDVLVGFPGESAEDFDELDRYLAGSPLTHVHVFPYSDRPGTPSVLMRPKVASAVVRERAGRLRAIAGELNRRFAARFIGTERPALTLADGSLALTDNYLKVRIPPRGGRNQRVTVRLVSMNPLRGEVVS